MAIIEMWVWLNGDIHFVAKHLHMPDLRFEEYQGEPCLVLSDPCLSLDIDETRSVVDGLLRAVNAATKVMFHPRLGSLVAKNVLFKTSDGSWLSPTAPVARMGNPTVFGVSDLEEGSPEWRRYSACIARARTDERFARACRYLTADPTWFNLYKVYEVIREAAGGKAKLDALGWWTQEDRESFEGSANDLNVSGELARHARTAGVSPPKRPITSDEGLALVTVLMRRWLESEQSPA